MSKEIRDEVVSDRLQAIVREFDRKITHSDLHIGRPYSMFCRAGSRKQLLPDAWWDATDAILEKLTPDILSELVDQRKNPEDAQPLAGAIARYEPVMNKLVHYYFPHTNAWNERVLDRSKPNVETIDSHMHYLQVLAKKTDSFSSVPTSSIPDIGAGLISLLEKLALYPEEAKKWSENHDGIEIIERCLVVHTLNECKFVSEKGRLWYRGKQGCLLVPFISHDRRLVGHGLVVYDRPLEGISLSRFVRNWKTLFAATFAPLMANLNSALLASLDWFFLGRTRELRKLRGPNNPRGPEGDIFRKSCFVDHFVINKIGLYEIVREWLDKKKEFRLVFFDLDGFKKVNQDIGHQAADVLLFYVVEELLRGDNCVFNPKKDSWLARFGGDEFIGIMPKRGSTKTTANKISQCITLAADRYNKYACEKDKPTIRDLKGEISTKEVTTSMGWVDSEDLIKLLKANFTQNIEVLSGMSAEYCMVELADTHAQKCVKGLGKNGSLEFGKRLDMQFEDDEKLGHNVLIKKLYLWLHAVHWLSPNKRSISEKLSFTPPRSR